MIQILADNISSAERSPIYTETMQKMLNLGYDFIITQAAANDYGADAAARESVKQQAEDMLNEIGLKHDETVINLIGSL